MACFAVSIILHDCFGTRWEEWSLILLTLGLLQSPSACFWGLARLHPCCGYIFINTKYCFKGLILSNFTALMKLQCSIKVMEQMFPYLWLSPPPPGCSTHLFGMVVSVLLSRIGLGLKYQPFLYFVLLTLMQFLQTHRVCFKQINFWTNMNTLKILWKTMEHRRGGDSKQRWCYMQSNCTTVMNKHFWVPWINIFCFHLLYVFFFHLKTFILVRTCIFFHDLWCL